MSIGATNRNDYTGNGATDTYSYTFKIFDESHLKVSVRDTSNVETELTVNVDYTVTGVGASGGGTIVLTAGNLTTDYHLTIRRLLPITQATDIRNQGEFLPEVHEDQFDRDIMIAQQQQDEIDRSMKISETFTGVDTSVPGPEGGKVISWNEAGTGLVNIDPGDATLQTPASDSIIADMINAAGTQATLTKLLSGNMAIWQKGADAASATALTLTPDGNYHDVTGTTAITSINTVGAGTWKLLQFDGSLTLTHHATNLILPGGSNIVTSSGDHVLLVEYATGQWRCAMYTKANGLPVNVFVKGADVISEAALFTTASFPRDGNYVDVTGVTAITSIITSGHIGTIIKLHFDGALTLTHHATDLILPGAANITTVAGDEAEFIEYASGDWRCTRYQRSSKRPDTGKIVQTVNIEDGEVATGTTLIPADDTIPQNTEGDEYMTLAITPTKSTNKLQIDIVIMLSSTFAATGLTAALFQDSTADALAAMSHSQVNVVSAFNHIVFSHTMTAGTTSSTTFKVRAGANNAGTVTFNGAAGARLSGGVMASSITITEIEV